MSRMWIPPGDYREGVKKIIYYPSSQGTDFNDLLAGCTDEDLNDSLKILETADNSVLRRRKIERELRIRDKSTALLERSTWNEWFKEEWNKIRMAAVKLREGAL